MGFAQQYTEDGVKISGQWNNISPAAYVQDNWRVSSRLTLNLGLRWDGIPHTYEANHLSSNFYPSLYNPANAATFDSNGNICSGTPVLGCARRPEPRVWSPARIPPWAAIQFYLNGIGIGGMNGIPKGLVKDSLEQLGTAPGLCL